jgi:hypothetical protein
LKYQKKVTLYGNFWWGKVFCNGTIRLVGGKAKKKKSLSIPHNKKSENQSTFKLFLFDLPESKNNQ